MLEQIQQKEKFDIREFDKFYKHLDALTVPTNPSEPTKSDEVLALIKAYGAYFSKFNHQNNLEIKGNALLFLSLSVDFFEKDKNVEFGSPLTDYFKAIFKQYLDYDVQSSEDLAAFQDGLSKTSPEIQEYMKVVGKAYLFKAHKSYELDKVTLYFYTLNSDQQRILKLAIQEYLFGQTAEPALSNIIYYQAIEVKDYQNTVVTQDELTIIFNYLNKGGNKHAILKQINLRKLTNLYEKYEVLSKETSNLAEYKKLAELIDDKTYIHYFSSFEAMTKPHLDKLKDLIDYPATKVLSTQACTAYAITLCAAGVGSLVIAKSSLNTAVKYAPNTIKNQIMKRTITSQTIATGLTFLALFAVINIIGNLIKRGQEYRNGELADRRKEFKPNSDKSETLDKLNRSVGIEFLNHYTINR